MTDVSRWRSAAALLAVYLLAMAIWFRVPIASGFDLGFGDRADGIIEISLLEHWRNVLTGHAAWNQPLYFHPYAGTLGYNDGYLLYGLVYSFWRIFFDPFLSDTLNLATFKTIGFFATYWLVARTLGWERPIALLIALLFTIASGPALQAVHAQLQSVALLPLLAILAIDAGRAEMAGRKARARLLALAAAALLAAWFLTSYYLPWFTLFFAGIWALCRLWAQGVRTPRALAGLLRRHAVTLAVAVTGLLVFLLPFLSIYLAKLGETGGHGFKISYLVTPIDLINVGPDNYVWGWLFRLFHAIAGAFAGAGSTLPDRWLRGEHETGFPLFLFALAVSAICAILRRRAPDTEGMRPFTLAVAIGWALTLKLWVVSAWILVHYLVPGASGIRVVLRYQIFLVLPVLLVTFAVYRHKALALARAKPLVAAALVALLLAEQLSAAPVAELSRSAQLADLETIPPPPAGCTSFYAVQTRRHEIPSQNVGSPIYYRNPANALKYLHNVDAMYLAQRWRVPTINGYSTFTPPGWDFEAPLAPDYDARVATYARAHRLDGLCRLDMRDPQPWRRVTPPIGGEPARR